MKQRTSHPPEQGGFTLVELIVGSAIGLLVTIGGLSLWLGNLRSTSTLNNQDQNLPDQWHRLVLFINGDIAEACAATGTANALTLTVDDTPETPCEESTRSIIYTLSNGTLERSGPLITDDGTLDLAGAGAIQEMLRGVTTFDATCTTPLEACYKLTLTRGTSTYTGTGTAGISGRLRVREY